MTGLPPAVAPLVRGPLLARPADWPLVLHAVLSDLRPAFIPKGEAGRGYRALARNGRILLASDWPVADLAGCHALVRVQMWHKAVFPGEPPEPYGILLCLRTVEAAAAPALGELRLIGAGEGEPDLCVDVGGRRWLAWVGPPKVPKSPKTSEVW